MGGSKEWRSRIVWTNDENGEKVPLRDANGKIVKISVKKYSENEKKKLKQIQKNNPDKQSPFRLDRRRIRRTLARNYDDEMNKIANSMTKDDEMAFVMEYNGNIKAEPAITADVRRISSSINAPLLGENKRRKTIESATQKRNRLIGIKDKSVMNDIIRFTNEVDINSFGKDVNKALKAYEEAGYTIAQVKNFWKKPWAYKGINVTLADKNGRLFEVQFHTKNSFEVKDSKEMHGLYEEQRKYPVGSPKYNDIDKKMTAIAEKLILTPVGVEDIENVNWD